MSRYQTKLPNGRVIAWGYDFPLKEYFLTEFWTPNESAGIEIENDRLDKMNTRGEIGAKEMQDGLKDEEVVFSIMSHTTTVMHPDYPGQTSFANSDFLEIMEKYPK